MSLIPCIAVLSILLFKAKQELFEIKNRGTYTPHQGVSNLSSAIDTKDNIAYEHVISTAINTRDNVAYEHVLTQSNHAM